MRLQDKSTTAVLGRTKVVHGLLDERYLLRGLSWLRPVLLGPTQKQALEEVGLEPSPAVLHANEEPAAALLELRLKPSKRRVEPQNVVGDVFDGHGGEERRRGYPRRRVPNPKRKQQRGSSTRGLVFAAVVGKNSGENQRVRRRRGASSPLLRFLRNHRRSLRRATGPRERPDIITIIIFVLPGVVGELQQRRRNKVVRISD